MSRLDATGTRRYTLPVGIRNRPYRPPRFFSDLPPRVNVLLSIPLEFRLALLLAIGAVVGMLLNLVIYGLAYFHPRTIGPWFSPPKGAPSRRWYDFLPIVGWIFLRREAKQHGRGFWVRPMLIELSTGCAFAALYRWDLTGGPISALSLAGPPELLHAQFLMQVLLVSLMIVATFIDFDEKTIPDAITVPGALLGLLLAAILPSSRLPIGVPFTAPIDLQPLRLTSPLAWPAWLDSRDGLFCGTACFLAWCFAVMPFVWNTRRGVGYAFRLLLASLLVRRASRPYHVLAAVGCVAIAIVWRYGPWHDLLSALVGMAFGGGLIWGVRIVGTRALGVEAMGFGDVILMAMIGAFLGWQSSLLIFFMAPFAALLIGVAQLLINRRTDIAFGPYLCLATLFLIVSWSGLWHDWAARIFFLGGQIPLMVAAGLVVMGGMLAAWRAIKERFFLEEDEPLTKKPKTRPTREKLPSSQPKQSSKKKDKKRRK